MHRLFSCRRPVPVQNLLARLSCFAVASALAGALAIAAAGQSRAAPTDAFDHVFTAIEGYPLPLEQFRGRPVLVANTASFCGFTPQYAALQALWERYRERGLVVLGVPSDDFNQELSENAAIKEFCEVNFGIDFPMTERVAVQGPGSHPLFEQIRQELGQNAGPNWNFFKYLIAPDGRIVASWSSRTPPDAAAITRTIERYLPPPS